MRCQVSSILALHSLHVSGCTCLWQKVVDHFRPFLLLLFSELTLKSIECLFALTQTSWAIQCVESPSRWRPNPDFGKNSPVARSWTVVFVSRHHSLQDLWNRWCYKTKHHTYDHYWMNLKWMNVWKIYKQPSPDFPNLQTAESIYPLILLNMQWISELRNWAISSTSKYPVRALCRDDVSFRSETSLLFSPFSFIW